MKKLISVLLLITTVFAFAACSVKNEKNDDKPKGTQPVSYTNPVTKIYNDLADTLPVFTFSNEISEMYDEGYSYTITVSTSQSEFESYIEAVKSGDYVIGTVTGENYYFAKNANGYKLECMYKDGIATIQVSR